MPTLQDLLGAHPKPRGGDVARAFEAIRNTVIACNVCADACLAEDDVAMLRRCIRLNLDCSDIGIATARSLSRQTEPNNALLRAQLEACAVASRECATECARHRHRHCQLTAEACRACEQACRDAISQLGSPQPVA